MPAKYVTADHRRCEGVHHPGRPGAIPHGVETTGRTASASGSASIGREYGTVTGRPRRTGWFDAVAARYTAALAGADEITVMLLDVLSGLPELKLCTAYDLNGERTAHFPSDAFRLERCRPVYETMPCWADDITAARTLADLPAAARRYVERVAELIGLPVAVVSVGPDRAQTILVKT